MVCQRCGAINAVGDQFCGNCGAALAPGYLPANGASAFPASGYGGALDATIAAQPPSSAQPPTQYVPPAYSPGGWAAPQNAYPPPPQETWADLPAGQIAPYVPSPAAQPSTTRRRRRWPWYLLLFLVIFGLVISASWVLLLRPAIHQSVDGQIRQGLQQAVDQIPPLAREAPAGLPFPVTQDQINNYLAQNVSQLAPITDMHITLQSDVMVVNFQAYGFGSTVRLGLAVRGGTLVAQQVDVSGLLWWVESADDLTARFDEALSQVPGKLGRQVASVAIDDGEIQFIFA
jgi:hypothetical protein